MPAEELWTPRVRQLAIGAAAAVALLIATAIASQWIVADYIAVVYIGALVGTGELVSRYRDAPHSALSTVPALLYIFVNAAASVAALYVVVAFGIAATGDADQVQISRVLLAGFGAMAFFRTSVFIIRVGEQDIAVGPVAFLQVILGATDRAVDRMRADDRASVVSRCMSGVSFDAAKVALPTFCLALMQNVTTDEEKAVGDAVTALQASPLDNDTRVKNLGLTLLNVVGSQVLLTAVRELGPQLRLAASLTIQDAPASLKAGGTAALNAVCRDSAGSVIDRKLASWSTSDSAIASVTADGHVRAKAAGTATISAQADAAADAVALTVTT